MGTAALVLLLAIFLHEHIRTSTFEFNITYEKRSAFKMYSHRFHRIVDFSLFQYFRKFC
jgi:hypothetical protein